MFDFNVQKAFFLIFLIVTFWLLFIAKMFPGAGWDASSIADVDISNRVLSFILLCTAFMLYLMGYDLMAAVLSIAAILPIAFAKKEN